MPNLKRSPVSYRPFEGRAILQDGLLAVARPGGEMQQALASALFGAADVFRQDAEATAARKGREAGLAAGMGVDPAVKISGGDRGPDVVTGGAPDFQSGGDVSLAPLRIANTGTRNKPVQARLAANVRRAVRDVYGEGYSVELFSGGQDAKGQGDKRTGSTRHDKGHAGDWYVIGPDGKRVQGDALAPLGQYWLANKLGGVGMEMAGGGIHLDHHTDRAPTWNYADKGGRYTPAMDKAIQAGLRGEGPKLKAGGGGVKAVISAAAARHGQPVGLLTAIASLESGLNPTAQNPSGAAGLYQFMPDTAAQYGLDNPNDPEAAADAAARLTRDNRAYLLKELGREPTWGEIYLAHQQGAGGAVKLIKNPSARAVDVVGGMAVTWNGGKEDMTAGEFAAMWTSKIDDRRRDEQGRVQPYSEGMGSIPLVDLDVNFDVTPGERSPLSIEVTGGMPALSGRDTLAGRAYDKAVLETYSARLQDQMLSAVDEIEAKFADDPVGLRDALSQLSARQLEGDVPPEIKADYESAFRRATRPVLRRVQGEHEKKIKQAEADDWFATSNNYEEALSRATVALKPGDADGAATLAGHAQRLKHHLKEGVARGILSPKQAAQQAQAVDSDVAAQWYITQGRDASPEDIEDLRTTLEADYGAGKLQGVDARGWAKINSTLGDMARNARAEERMNTAQLADATDSLLNRAALGYQISPEELSALRATADKVAGGEDMVSDTMEVLTIAESLRNRPVAEAEKILNKMRDGMGKTPTDKQVAMYSRAEMLVDKAKLALRTDLLGYAERAGVIESAGTLEDVKTAQDMEGLMKARLASAAVAAERFGVEERYFRPGEVEALEAMVTADPDNGAKMAAAMITASDKKIGAVLSVFGKNAPLLAGAGAILAGGGDAVAARDALTTKDENGKPYEVKGERARREAAIALVDIALTGVRGSTERVLGTAERIARKRIVEKGLDPEGLEAAAEHEKAVNEAMGAVYEGQTQWGGLGAYDPGFSYAEHKVVVPSTMRADRLSDVVDALRPEDLTQQPMGGIEVLQDQWPVWTGSGWNFVTVDDAGQQEVLLGTDNKPFVLPVAGLAQKLGKRVPGAFRGY